MYGEVWVRKVPDPEEKCPKCGITGPKVSGTHVARVPIENDWKFLPVKHVWHYKTCGHETPDNS
jgi:hypothetical protein